MRRTDHPHIHFNRSRPAQSLDSPILQRAQHLRLCHRTHVPNLIQKNRPSRSQLEFSFTLLRRARECPLLVSKQLRLDQIFRQCRAIHGNKRFPSPRRPRVNLLRQQILPGSAFAKNQHGCIAGRHPVSHLKNTLHRRRRAKHPPKLPVRHKLAPQSRVLNAQLLNLQNIRHPRTQLRNVESLHNVIRRPALKPLNRGLRRVQRRHDKHRRLVAAFSQRT